MPNYVADNVGRFNVMLAMTSLSAILVLAFWLPARGNGALITFAAPFGIASGAIIGLVPVLTFSISRMNEMGYQMGSLGFRCSGDLDQFAHWRRHYRRQWKQLHLYVRLFRREPCSGHHWSCGSTRAAFGMWAYYEGLSLVSLLAPWIRFRPINRRSMCIKEIEYKAISKDF